MIYIRWHETHAFFFFFRIMLRIIYLVTDDNYYYISLVYNPKQRWRHSFLAPGGKKSLKGAHLRPLPSTNLEGDGTQQNADLRL